MLTYVINTSENKTFDSSKLFELAGYSKIRWVQCSLNDIPKCVEYISEKQNSILADEFRIAVVIDFYGFDKIRMPYGRKGFIKDEGVDMSLYMPYLEVYLLDNLIVKLENKELYAKDFEIYYVQNEKSERYELFNSAPTQIRQILWGTKNNDTVTPSEEELERLADVEISDSEVEQVLRNEAAQAKANAEDAGQDIEETLEKEENLTPTEIQEREYKKKIAKKMEMYKARNAENERNLYNSFTLYCTPKILLEFPLADYPYGEEKMNFADFWDAFRARVARKVDLRRHYYVVPYGGGPSRSALHTLSLCLYLIHMYEREEYATGEGDMDVEKIDTAMLCEVLESGWGKINAAKLIAKQNDMDYYSLMGNSIIKTIEDNEEEVSPETAIMKEKATLPKNITNTNMSGDRLYTEVEAFASRTPSELKDRNRDEFDKIMLEYLNNRDKTRESDIEAEFLSLKNGGFLETTKQCPSREQYNHLVNEKHKQISKLFEKVLTAEYIEVDYSEEKERSNAAYLDYKKAKAMTGRNIIGDIIFLILAVASVIVPYWLLQLTSYASNTMASVILALSAAGIFGGLFVCSIIFQLIPAMYKLNKAKTKLYNCYLDCCAKEKYSFSAIRRRYERDLVAIEQTRYELRQLKRLFDENLEKEKNVLLHRKMLDEMADCLSSMLNNLDVEPVFDDSESVEGEFDLSKSLYSRDNKVYQIFSLETIEKIFSKKGRETK